MLPIVKKWRCLRCKLLYFGQEKPVACEVCFGDRFRPVVDAADLPPHDLPRDADDAARGAHAA